MKAHVTRQVRGMFMWIRSLFHKPVQPTPIGLLVCLGPDGYAVPANDSRQYMFIGTATGWCYTLANGGFRVVVEGMDGERNPYQARRDDWAQFLPGRKINE